MSSGTSTDATVRGEPLAAPRPVPEAPRGPVALQPWQFFLLAGMLAAAAAVVVSAGRHPAALLVLSLTVVAAALAGLGLYRVVQPLVDPDWSDAPDTASGRLRSALEREKALVLRAIKELEFDHAMGKLATSDFEDMSSRLRARALRLLRELEGGGTYRSLIERELELRLGRKPAPLPAPPSGPPGPPAGEAGVPPPAGEGAGASVQYCPQCGLASGLDARFCRACGTRLA